MGNPDEKTTVGQVEPGEEDSTSFMLNMVQERISNQTQEEALQEQVTIKTMTAKDATKDATKRDLRIVGYTLDTPADTMTDKDATKDASKGGLRIVGYTLDTPADPGHVGVEGGGPPPVALQREPESMEIGAIHVGGRVEYPEASEFEDGPPLPATGSPEDPELALLASARPVEPEEGGRLIQRAQPMTEGGKPDTKLGQGVIIMAALAAVAIAIVLGSVLGTRGKDSGSNSGTGTAINDTAIPTDDAETFDDPRSNISRVINLPSYTLDSIVNDPSSPQALAYEWVIRDPNLEDHTEAKRTQRFALATFFHALNGEEWSLNDGWLNWTLDECDWYHRELVDISTNVWAMRRLLERNDTMANATNTTNMICNDKGEYLYLVFTANDGMKGTIPPELELLPELRLLDLSNNGEVIGPIPTEIGNLKQLRRLNVARNAHSGLMPTEVGLLTKLEEIYAEHNLVNGPVPSQIGNLGDSLRILSLGRSGFTGFLPTELYRLSKLEEYLIQNNEGITGGSLEGLHQMIALKKMVVHDVPYKQAIPSEIGLLSHLNTLNVWNTQLKGNIPSQFCQLTNLYRLDMDDNYFSGTFPTELEALSNLNAVWLNGNEFTGTIPSNIWHSFHQLKVLALNGNKMTGSIPTEVGLLSTSEPALDLRFNNQPFWGTIPSEFGNIPNVSKIFLHNTSLTGTIPEELANLDLNILEAITLSHTSVTGPIPSVLCDDVKDMVFVCLSVLGVVEQLCTATELMNFSCADSLLCGCTCKPCA